MESDLKLPINKGFKFLLALSCVVILIGGLKLASDLVVPIVLAFFLSVITMPILKLLRSYGVPRFIAVILTIVVGRNTQPYCFYWSQYGLRISK